MTRHVADEFIHAEEDDNEDVLNDNPGEEPGQVAGEPGHLSPLEVQWQQHAVGDHAQDSFKIRFNQ